MDRAYLLGFKSGDLTVWQVSGTSIMVTSTTTHRAFVELFDRLFSAYGPVYQYPMYEKGKGYRWKVATRVDNSFQFLLTTPLESLKLVSSDEQLFYSWLAGFVDSDGSILIGKSGTYSRTRLALGNTNVELLHSIRAILVLLGFHPDGPYLQYERGTTTPYATYTKDMWVLTLQRTNEAKEILSRLPLRHQERVKTGKLASDIPKAIKWADVEERVINHRRKIASEVTGFVQLAENMYKARHDKGKCISAADSKTEKNGLGRRIIS